MGCSPFPTALSSELSQFRENFKILRLLPQFVNFCPRDFARFVDDKNRAVVDKGDLVLGRRENSVSCRGFSVGPAVGPQWEFQPAQVPLKGDVAKHCVC